MGFLSKWSAIFKPIMDRSNCIINDFNRHARCLSWLFIVSIILLLYINAAMALTLDKGASVSSAYFGDSVDYTYDLTNVNDGDLSNIVIYDDRLGMISFGPLANNAVGSKVVNHIINESDMIYAQSHSGVLANHAYAVGDKSGGGQVTSNSAGPVEIDVGFDGKLDVRVIPSSPPRPIGQNMSFNIVVTNTNGCTIHDVNVTDYIYITRQGSKHG